MHLLENIVWVLTAVAVAGVIGFAAVGPLKSEISDRTIEDDFRKIPAYLEQARRDAESGEAQPALAAAAPAATQMKLL